MERRDLCDAVRVAWKVLRCIWCTREQLRCVRELHRNPQGEIMQSEIAQSILSGNAPSFLLAAGLFAMAVPFAHAGAELKISDEASVSVGLGLRASFT